MISPARNWGPGSAFPDFDTLPASIRDLLNHGPATVDLPATRTVLEWIAVDGEKVTVERIRRLFHNVDPNWRSLYDRNRK